MNTNIVNSVLIEECIVAKSYTGGTTDPVPVAVDVQMCQTVAGVLDVGTLGGTITLTLTECDTSTGTFTTMTTTGTATLTVAGLLVIEGKPTKKYVKMAPVQIATKTDVMCGMIIGMNPVHYPIT